MLESIESVESIESIESIEFNRINQIDLPRIFLPANSIIHKPQIVDLIFAGMGHGSMMIRESLFIDHSFNVAAADLRDK